MDVSVFISVCAISLRKLHAIMKEKPLSGHSNSPSAMPKVYELVSRIGQLNQSECCCILQGVGADILHCPGESWACEFILCCQSRQGSTPGKRTLRTVELLLVQPNILLETKVGAKNLCKRMDQSDQCSNYGLSLQLIRIRTASCSA